MHQEEAAALISRLLGQLMKSDKYGERRGAAFGLAGVVKGFRITCLKKYNITTDLQNGLSDRYIFSVIPCNIFSLALQGLVCCSI